MDGEPNPSVGRRRALTIVAGAAAALLPGGASRRTPPRYEWCGTALGAAAKIVLYADDRARAQVAIDIAAAEIERLENEFSLYRPRSALSRLNRNGLLDGPSLDMLRLLSEARHYAVLSGGAFDVTVQPLWQLYAEHFAAHPGDEQGPSRAAVERALARVDYRRLHIAADHITLAPGMAVTLNGIAQGYITDRIADLLCARGWSRMLIDLGELRALGPPADSGQWRVGISDPLRERRLLAELPITAQAVATSAGLGTRFDRRGRHHHLFVPSVGRSATEYRSVTVVARRATTADALSTALFVSPRAEAARLLRRAGPAEAWLLPAGATSLQRLRG